MAKTAPESRRNASPTSPQDSHTMSFLDLPPELIHSVFAHLDLADVLSARLACRSTAEIGLDYMLSTVYGIYKRDRLERLGEIAAHPMAKNVRSLYFQADRLREPAMSYKVWEKEREVLVPNEELHSVFSVCDHDSSRGIGEREVRDFARATCKCKDTLQPSVTRGMWLSEDHYIISLRRLEQHADGSLQGRYERIRKGQYSRKQLRQAYEQYVATVQDQKDLAQSKADLSCLVQFFTGCNKLDKVTLALSHGIKGNIDAVKIAFQDGMIQPFGDSSMINQGVHQFWLIAQALRDSGRYLRHFTAIDLSPRIFRSTWDGVSTDDLVSHLMTNLREFRIEFTCLDDRLDMGVTSGEAAQDMEDYYNKGLLAQWLDAGPNLRVMKIKLHMSNPPFLHPALEHSIGTRTWHKLRELALQQLSTTEDYLVDILIRHKESLRRLALSEIEIIGGTWESTLNRIGGKLTKLKKMKLRGHLRDDQVEYFFGDHELDRDRVDAFRDSIESYILYGGEMPELLPDHTALGPDDGKPVSEVPGYKQTGRMDDEDAGYTTDGSAISYGSDELDMRM